MNAAVRESPPPRPCHDAAAFPSLVIPVDTPAHARRVLASLDAAIAREAVREAGVPPGKLGSEVAAILGGVAAENAIPASPMSRDGRLVVAGRMHVRARGATAFFLFHYLRLLEEQVEARRAGTLCPAQTWAMPDWHPPLPARSGTPAVLQPESPSRMPRGAMPMPDAKRSPGPICDRTETSTGSTRYQDMSLDDVPPHLQPKVDRLVQMAKAELEARGIDTAGKLPRQILRMAQIERHKPGQERGRQKRMGSHER